MHASFSHANDGSNWRENLVAKTNGLYYYDCENRLTEVNDINDSPVALTDSDGDVIERYEYDAYGQPTIRDAQYAIRDTSLYGNNYLFTGRRIDILDSGSLKYYYYRTRAVAPYMGRMLQHDLLSVNPMGGMYGSFAPVKQYLDGLNLYEYAHSNPTNRMDPFGAKCIFEPLGWRPPQEVGENIYQTGWTSNPLWKIKSKVRNYYCQANCHRVWITALTCKGKYWWSTDDGKWHEEIHVEIWNDVWDRAVAKANDYFNKKCMFYKKVGCYVSALSLWSEAYYAEGFALNCALDHRAYSDPDSQKEAGLEAEKARIRADKAKQSAQKKEKECDAMTCE